MCMMGTSDGSQLRQPVTAQRQISWCAGASIGPVSIWTDRQPVCRALGFFGRSASSEILIADGQPSPDWQLAFVHDT